MSKGAVLFAHNSESTDYFKMAVYAATRIQRFLDIPVSVITDRSSVTCEHNFDHVIFREPDRSNTRKKGVWINKGRYEVYDLTPYTDTLVLDTDYLVNSDKLLKLFDMPQDFLCHRRCRFMMEKFPAERISPSSFETLWATVLRFRKTTRTKEIFNMIEMVQKNYEHYGELHQFSVDVYRNDYALTLALHTVNGHVENSEDYIPWDLIHAGISVHVRRIADTEYCLEYKPNETDRPHYLIIRDQDFHMLHKDNFMELAK